MLRSEGLRDERGFSGDRWDCSVMLAEQRMSSVAWLLRVNFETGRVRGNIRGRGGETVFLLKRADRRSRNVFGMNEHSDAFRMSAGSPHDNLGFFPSTATYFYGAVPRAHQPSTPLVELRVEVRIPFQGGRCGDRRVPSGCGCSCGCGIYGGVGSGGGIEAPD